MLLLSPIIDEAIRDYYGQYFSHDPWADQVLDISATKEDEKLFCIVKLQVIPYTGPHNSVGIDNITLIIEEGPKVRVEKFNHLDSHKLLKNTHDYYIRLIATYLRSNFFKD